MPWRVLLSPRVSTFLSAVSRYQATVRHLAGSANVPSDFASRNAAVCVEQQCQVCTFIRETEESVVMQRVTTDDITSERANIPFTIRCLARYLGRVPRSETYSCAPQARDETVEENHKCQGRETLSECCIHRSRWYVSCTPKRPT